MKILVSEFGYFMSFIKFAILECSFMLHFICHKDKNVNLGHQFPPPSIARS